MPISVDTDGSVFNGKGWIGGKRLSSSGAVKDGAYNSITGYIPAKAGDVIRTNIGVDGNSEYIYAYNESFGIVGYSNGDNSSSAIGKITTANNASTLTLTNNSTIRWIRVSAQHGNTDPLYSTVANPADGPGPYMIVTVNEEIT